MRRVASVRMGFSLSEEADEIEEAVIADAVEGIQSATVDGMTVSMQDPMKRLDVVDRLRTSTASTQSHFGLRHTRLIGPSAWSE
jgi:hypothetical protein